MEQFKNYTALISGIKIARIGLILILLSIPVVNVITGTILIANIFWFLNAPAYRFGIAYNFSLLILFFLPFWGYFLFANKTYFNLILRIYLFIGIIIFSYQNIYKSKKYIDRYGFDWPNVKEGKYLEKLN